MDMYKGKCIEDFDTEGFQDQPFCIVSLYIYQERVNDSLYIFPCLFVLKDILMKPFQKVHCTQNLTFFENQGRIQFSTPMVYWDSWSKNFKENYLMCDKYSQVLTDLAHTPNKEINVQIH